MCVDITADHGVIDLAEKRQFLLQPSAYSDRPVHVELRETHMSLVFLTQDKVYKLKKPVHLDYLNFSSLVLRERACRAELNVNRRLAADVYLAVVPLTCGPEGLAVDGEGRIVDWLVVMRRLDNAEMLDRRIAEGRISNAQADQLVAQLIHFYRHASRVFLKPDAHRAAWRHAIAYNYTQLCHRDYNLPRSVVARLFHVQRRFLEARGALLDARVRRHHLVDAHGDLRPEHIWLGKSIRIIDSLEFDPKLRRLDPFDEAAYLSLECERLGAAWLGARIRTGLVRALKDGPSKQLFAFYKCYRASLRARLAIAHLSAPSIRTPEKWRPLAQAYLRLAGDEARRLERFLNGP